MLFIFLILIIAAVINFVLIYYADHANLMDNKVLKWFLIWLIGVVNLFLILYGLYLVLRISHVLVS